MSDLYNYDDDITEEEAAYAYELLNDAAQVNAVGTPGQVQAFLEALTEGEAEFLLATEAHWAPDGLDDGATDDYEWDDDPYPEIEDDPQRTAAYDKAVADIQTRNPDFYFDDLKFARQVHEHEGDIEKAAAAYRVEHPEEGGYKYGLAEASAALQGDMQAAKRNREEANTQRTASALETTLDDIASDLGKAR
jgi:hypothetical protein